MNRSLFLLLWSTLLVQGCGGGSGAASGPPAKSIVSIALAGQPVKIFDHTKDKQEPLNIPDAPVTAWKEANGTVDLLISHYEAYRMRGTDLAHLSIDPAKIYSSTLSASQIQENLYNYHNWLIAPYSADGVNFYSLVHTEWYACLLNGDCGIAAPNGLSTDLNSWANSINSFVSADGGASWQPNVVAGSHVVANTAFQWTGSQELAQRVYLQALNHSGMFNPSRLVQEGAWWYAVCYYIHRDFTKINTALGVYEAPVDQSGYVLIRTSDFTHPNGWQAWNGSAYVPMTNLDFLAFHPLSNGVAVDGAPPQLIHDTVANCFVLLYTLYAGSNPVYYTFTTSLANPSWSDSAQIGGSAQLVIDPAGPVQGFSFANYPSILDDSSSGFNFEFTNGNPLLFYSTSPAAYGGDNLARDVYSVQLKITYSP